MQTNEMLYVESIALKLHLLSFQNHSFCVTRRNEKQVLYNNIAFDTLSPWACINCSSEIFMYRQFCISIYGDAL